MEYLYFVQILLVMVEKFKFILLEFYSNVVALSIQVIFTGDPLKVYLLLQTYYHTYLFK